MGPQAEDRFEGEEISDMGAAEFEVTSRRWCPVGFRTQRPEAGRESGTREGLKVPSGSVVRVSTNTDGIAQTGAGRVSRCNTCEKDEKSAEETEGGWSGRCGGSEIACR